MPLFSVIINNYNYGHFLDSAIGSIVSQRFRDFELIVVDDGSSDDSISRVLKYGRQVKLIQTARLGQARACQRAVRDATGSYLYILDADDEANPDLLLCASRLLADKPCKLQFRLEPINAIGAVLGKPFPNFPKAYESGEYARNEQIKTIIKTGCCIAPPTSGNIFRADLFGYIDDIDYEKAIDGIPLLLAPFIGNVVTIDRPLARYRIHTTNDSGFLNPTPQKFAVERDRFAARYQHLRRLNDRYQFGAFSFYEPSKMLRYRDRDIMSKLCADELVPAREVRKFLAALISERGISLRALRLVVWICICKFGPRWLARLFFAFRANPHTHVVFSLIRRKPNLVAREGLPNAL